jgi:hypothetical protein
MSTPVSVVRGLMAVKMEARQKKTFTGHGKYASASLVHNSFEGTKTFSALHLHISAVCGEQNLRKSLRVIFSDISIVSHLLNSAEYW